MGIKVKAIILISILNIVLWLDSIIQLWLEEKTEISATSIIIPESSIASSTVT